MVVLQVLDLCRRIFSTTYIVPTPITDISCLVGGITSSARLHSQPQYRLVASKKIQNRHQQERLPPLFTPLLHSSNSPPLLVPSHFCKACNDCIYAFDCISLSLDRHLSYAKITSPASSLCATNNFSNGAAPEATSFTLA
jgi:hypothetical protein